MEQSLKSQQLQNHKDFSRLIKERLKVSKVGQYLVIYEVPYLDKDKVVKKGRLFKELSLQGDKINPPANHQIYFEGEEPFKANGTSLSQDIGWSPFNTSLGDGLNPDLLKYGFSSIDQLESWFTQNELKNREEELESNY